MERAEAFVLGQGFRQVRVRDLEGAARVEVESTDVPRLLEPALGASIIDYLRQLGFASVTLDPAGYRQGGGNS